MKVTISSLTGALNYKASNERGFSFEYTGTENGVRPMESVLMAAGICSSIDVELFLKKMRQNCTKIEVECSAEREVGPPAVFKKIYFHFHLYGEIKEEKAQKALDMSFGTHCSVSKMLEKTASIQYTFSLRN